MRSPGVHRQMPMLFTLLTSHKMQRMLVAPNIHLCVCSATHAHGLSIWTVDTLSVVCFNLFGNVCDSCVCYVSESITWIQDRELLPRELLAAMGLRRVRFQTAIDEFAVREGDVRRFCGNGMHCATLASVFMWAAINSR